MSDNDGGSAFPKQPVFHYPHGATSAVEQEGMSLRDYFAAKAMQGLITCSWFSFRSKSESASPLHQNENELAVDAYAFADAMLAAREAKS